MYNLIDGHWKLQEPFWLFHHFLLLVKGIRVTVYTKRHNLTFRAVCYLAFSIKPSVCQDCSYSKACYQWYYLLVLQIKQVVYHSACWYVGVRALKGWNGDAVLLFLLLPFTMQERISLLCDGKQNFLIPSWEPFARLDTFINLDRLDNSITPNFQ